jgi:hypothetical protein
MVVFQKRYFFRDMDPDRGICKAARAVVSVPCAESREGVIDAASCALDFSKSPGFLARNA